MTRVKMEGRSDSWTASVSLSHYSSRDMTKALGMLALSGLFANLTRSALAGSCPGQKGRPGNCCEPYFGDAIPRGNESGRMLGVALSSPFAPTSASRLKGRIGRAWGTGEEVYSVTRLR